MKKHLLLLSLFLLWMNSSYANVVGADTQNFNPTTNGLDFVTVHSSETLKPGILNFGLFLNYAVNSLPNHEDTTTQTRTNFQDSLLSADMNVGFGILRNWDVGFSVPMLLSQSVTSDVAAFRGQFAETGLTEFRGNTKYRFLGNDAQGLAAVVSFNLNQIVDNPFAGSNPGPTFNFELAGDTTLEGVWALGGNIGYRLRQPGDKLPNVPIEPLGDQLIASAAVSYLIPSYDVKVIGELFGSYPMKDTVFASDRDLSSLEALLGAKWDVNRSIALHGGFGTEVIHGTSSPDWRIYTGINWVLGPLYGQEKEPVIYRVDETREDSSEEDFFYDNPYAIKGKPLKKETFRARDILFEFNSATVHPYAKQSLQEFVDYLMGPAGFKRLIIEGHTDSVGSEAYNQKLSLKRAQMVRKVLVSMGLPGNKVVAVGLGESQPIADNGNFQGRAINRRVEFQVSR
ncbi:MAG TPA: hypothetical protein DCL41_04010 [Bdellovibrionales bacterium]|nr:hypothetical protein [Pseudobdellovibrionaceae bacterium]HAG91008.1 hypothetical protein [Bdellovibrionales bacterium]|tara:strand:- start:3166 stop:4533 length:1368 start_codon:yes stop_codon:yes gene_type:complete